MNLIEIPKHVLANIEWIDSDDPKYKSRSREAYPYCENCDKNHPQDETEPKAYIYENATGNLYLHCPGAVIPFLWRNSQMLFFPIDEATQAHPERRHMQNRLKQLPLNVQKHVYQIAGMAGTSCPNWGSTEYNQATTAFLVATDDKNYKTSLMTTPDTTLNTGSAGTMSCKKPTGPPNRGASIVSIYGPQNGNRNVKPFSTVLRF